MSEWAAAAPAAPSAAAETFGARLALAQAYAGALVTAGAERGLIGPRERDRVWSRHLLNSAALAEVVPADTDVLDLGSGAGLPGIPLALARPDLTVTLVEPLERRVVFLHQVAEALALPVRVHRARAEQLERSSADVVVARALAPLERLVSLALPLLRPGGLVLALKGRTAGREIDEARDTLARWRDVSVDCVSVGQGDSSATIVRLQRAAASEDK